jgi:DNA ligase D-like protein (predicted 3'-phosphoesterase)
VADERLSEYHRKRKFDRTPEPHGSRKSQRGAEPIFVIQHHMASREHYDFRLEVDGVLKSWSVPKGPSLDPAEKRLAVPTEDHPVDYAAFEGTIPKGEYGGGVVMVWDTGTYENTTEHKGEPVSMAEGIEAGHVTFDLTGSKVTGEFALTRTRGGDHPTWLLIKKRGDGASARRDPVKSATKSVLTGRTMKQIETQSR